MKILSLAPSVTETMFALGAESCLVGVTSLCDYPLEARNLPRIGGWIDAKPQLLDKIEFDVAIGSMFVSQNVIAYCEEKDKQLVTLNPRVLADVFQDIIQIGELVDKNQEARAIVGQMKNVFNAVNAKPKSGLRVYVEEWSTPPMASGNWVPELVQFVGGISFCQSGKLSQAFLLNDLKVFDPQVIILSICGAGDKKSPTEVKQRVDWRELSAVKNNNIFVIEDSLLNRPSPRLARGAEKLWEIFSTISPIV